MIDIYQGQVDKTFRYMSELKDFFGSQMKTVAGSDTIMVRRVGTTALKKVTSGVRPAAGVVGTGKTSLTIDTMLIARENVGKLDHVQSDVNMIAEIGEEHGKTIAQFVDETYAIKVIHTAQMAADSDGIIKAGYKHQFTGAKHHQDAAQLYTGLASIINRMKKDNQKPAQEGFCIFLDIDTYEVLLQHPKLLDFDYSARKGGNFAEGIVKQMKGVPIKELNCFPTAVNNSHLMGSGYNVAAKDLLAKGFIVHPKALLVGQAIGVTSNIHWSDVELQWFIDSYLAFGCGPRRQDRAGLIMEKAA